MILSAYKHKILINNWIANNNLIVDNLIVLVETHSAKNMFRLLWDWTFK